MKLKEFFAKYKYSKELLAVKCQISYPAIMQYLQGKRIPRQKVAERIEKETDGLVTVLDLRGTDDRKKSNN